MIAITFRLEFCKMDLQENELKQEDGSYFCQIALVGRVAQLYRSMDFRIHGAIVDAKSFILLAERINLNA